MRKIYVFKLVVLLVWFSFLGAGCASERIGGNDVEAEKKSEIPNKKIIQDETLVKKEFQKNTDQGSHSSKDGIQKDSIDGSDLSKRDIPVDVSKTQENGVLNEILHVNASLEETIGKNKSVSKSLPMEDSENSLPAMTKGNVDGKQNPPFFKLEKNEHDRSEKVEFLSENSDQMKNDERPLNLPLSKDSNYEVGTIPSNMGGLREGLKPDKKYQDSNTISKIPENPLSDNEENQNIDSSDSLLKKGVEAYELIEKDNGQKNSLDDSEDLKITLGLKEIFEEKSEPSSKESPSNVRFKSSFKGGGNETSLNANIGFRNLNTKKIDDKSGPSRKIVLGQKVAEESRESTRGLKTVNFTNSSYDKALSNVKAGDTLKVGFRDKTNINFNNTPNEFPQQVGHHDPIKKLTDEKTLERTRVPLLKNRNSKDYGSVLNYLATRNQSGIPEGGNDEEVRHYNNLRKWRPANDESNHSEILQESSSKQFNRALEWIRQKGRIAKD